MHPFPSEQGIYNTPISFFVWYDVISQPTFFAAPKIWCHPPLSPQICPLPVHRHTFSTLLFFYQISTFSEYGVPFQMEQNQAPLSFRVPVFHFWVIWCKISTNIFTPLKIWCHPTYHPQLSPLQFLVILRSALYTQPADSNTLLILNVLSLELDELKPSPCILTGSWKNFYFDTQLDILLYTYITDLADLLCVVP